MKLLKKCWVLGLSMALISMPMVHIIANNNPVYSSNKLANVNQSKERVTIYSNITGETIASYGSKVNGTLYVTLGTLCDLLNIDYERIHSNKIWGITGGLSDNSKTVFECTVGNKGAIFNDKYVLLSAAPSESQVPLKEFVQNLGYKLTYDNSVGSYIIAKNGETVNIDVPTYPTKKISYNYGSKSVNIDTVVIGDILCVNALDIADLLDLTYDYDGRLEYGRGRYLEDEYTRINFHIGFASLWTDDGEVILPLSPFDYPFKGVYLPIESFANLFGFDFAYTPNTNTAIIH